METDNQATGTPDPAVPAAGAATATNAAPPAASNVAASAADKPAAEKSAKRRGKPAAKPKSGAPASESDDAATAEKAEANPQTVEVWPLRSYQDAGEIKRRGGKSYTVPKRHADALIARGLASNKKPAAKADPDSDK
ncbi:hypothetical protein [Stutzerimonas nitrititolerans]|uniref:hypothetical protein n=1 Tax=Stutzerimonas nitrititolerans TaxID=2482751 RepID=UPI00289F5413|nr:hypothetical protein [Stutzerimonas nitrititolerans]